MVFSGLRAAWRRASSPTRRSPDLVKATTEGVVREPSELGMTTGSQPSITASAELVVPKSIPTVLCICQHFLQGRAGARFDCFTDDLLPHRLGIKTSLDLATVGRPGCGGRAGREIRCPGGPDARRGRGAQRT